MNEPSRPGDAGGPGRAASDGGESAGVDGDCANEVYYLGVGPGRWTGDFGFTVTDWRAFVADSIGVKYRLTVLAIVAVMTLFGEATIVSEVEGHPDRGAAGVAVNDLRITLFGLTLYYFRDRYELDPNCRDADISTEERIGPVPGLFTATMEYTAEIELPGPVAHYDFPLLNADWTGRYEVRDDGDEIAAALTCEWATAKEVIHRVG